MARSRASASGVRCAIILLITCIAFAVLGYHPGAEDDTTYLAAVKHDLNPALFPHDLAFVTSQLEVSRYDSLIAVFVRCTHLPLPDAILLWQFAGIFVLLLCCWHIAARCFPEPSARWSAISFVGAILAMPVTATHLVLVDQYLHPRLLATDCILLAVLALLRAWPGPAAAALVAGFLMHPLMAAFGASFCCFLFAEQRWPGWAARSLRSRAGFILRSFSLPEPWVSRSSPPSSWISHSWLWEQPTPAWERATAPRTFLYLYKWPWYAWIGVAGPPALAAAMAERARRRGEETLALLCSGVATYSVSQLLLAMLLLLPGAPAWFVQLEPMRFLHLTYLLTALLAGGAFGRWWLGRQLWRWFLVFAPLAACFYVEQGFEFAGTPHIEWPGAKPANPWLDAFAWVRTNTPVDAYFALDPRYAEAPGEGTHSFRALAERSMLADAVKDPGVVTHVPHLASRWTRETEARAGWQSFSARDFEHLQDNFGVNWILIDRRVSGLACPYHNSVAWVCRLGT